MSPSFCACCVRDSNTLEPEVDGGRIVWVCRDCRELPVSDARYSFGGGKGEVLRTLSSNIGEGNKRSGGRRGR